MKRLAYALLYLSGIVVALSCGKAENVNGLVSEQIASHFEQVFSPYNQSSNRDRDSWLPGNDLESGLFGMDIELGGTATWVATTSAEDNNHDVDVFFSEASYSLSYPFKPGKKIGFVTRVSNYFIDETAGNEAPVFDYDHISQVDLGFMYTTNLSPSWDLFLGTGMILSDGTGALQNSRVNYLLFLGASVTISPDLTIAFGGMASTNESFENGLFPQFMLEWRINDRNRLSIRDGLYYQHALTDDWRNIIGFSFENFGISVEEDEQWIKGKLRHTPTRIISDYSLNLIYSHWFRNGFIIETKAGLAHIGNHSIWDGDKKLAGRDLETAVGMSVGLSYRF
jgi:hypothetical protein